MAQLGIPDGWWMCCKCENGNYPALTTGRCAACSHSRCYTCQFPGEEPNPTRQSRVTRARSRTNVTVSRLSYPVNINSSNSSQQRESETAGTDVDDASSESVSDRDSVFSYGYSETSQTTMGSTDMQDSLVDEVVRILCVNELLFPLSQGASRNVRGGGNRLENNFRRLLVKYAHDLKREAGSSLRGHRAIAQFVSRFAGRISSEICLLVSGDQRESFEMLRKSSKESSGRLKVEELLKRTRGRYKAKEKATEDEALDSDDDVSEPEDDEHEYDDDASFPEISRAEKLLLRSASFQSLVYRLNDWVYPSFQIRVQKLLDLLPKPDGHGLDIRLRHELCQVVAEIQYIPPDRIFFDNGRKLGWLNHLQGLIQVWFGEKWDWWPLHPFMRPLSDGEARVFWACTCGESRWAEVPVSFAEMLSRTIKKSMPADEEAAGRHQNVQSQASSSSYRGHEAGNQAQKGALSPKLGKNSLEIDTHSTGEPGLESPEAALRYVLLLVTSGNSNRLSQIEVHEFDNNQFFRFLRSEYRRLRGTLRTILSVWRFSHCDFYQCEKFDDSEYTLRKKDEYPDMHNSDYDYNPRPMPGVPPISAHEFYSRFYACYRPDPRSVHLFHQCKKARSHSSEVLDMLPKKKSELEEGGDQREVFWGIYAREMPCFRVVIIYNILCLLPLVVFLFLWLFPLGHGADLESASVPLSIMLGMLSLFWSVFLGSLHSYRAGIVP